MINKNQIFKYLLYTVIVTIVAFISLPLIAFIEFGLNINSYLVPIIFLVATVYFFYKKKWDVVILLSLLTIIFVIAIYGVSEAVKGI